MCTKMNHEKLNRKDKARRKSQLPPMPKPSLFDEIRVEDWWAKLTPKQRRSLKLGAK